KRRERGAMDMKVTEEGNVALVRWLDNEVVNIESTQVGDGAVGVATRWSEAAKERVEIPCPEAVVQYNRLIGGVDKLDFVMALYPMKAKTRKWTLRVMPHFITLAVANSWLECLRDASSEGLSREKQTTHYMLFFQTEVALSLVQSNKDTQTKRGRPSTESLEVGKRHAHNARPAPPNALRHDRKDHWPQHIQAPFPQRSKYERCTSKTRVRCRKCDVFLCVSSTNDCYFLYHNA
ncbi:conserved hypothetical protein, partial [Ixodes scapularis]